MLLIISKSPPAENALPAPVTITALIIRIIVDVAPDVSELGMRLRVDRIVCFGSIERYSQYSI
jgi:hypothetical protein